MCDGEKRVALVALVAFSTLLILACSNRDRPRNETSSVSSKATVIDVRKELSGIWYRSPNETINNGMEAEFSWGVTRYDYWNALRIDLLGNQSFLGFADATWNSVTAETDSKNMNAVRLHLGQKDSPEKEEAVVTFEGKDLIRLVFTTNVTVGTIKMITGKYYKVFDPGSLPANGKTSQIGNE